MRRAVRLKHIKVINKPNGKRYVYRRVGARLVPLPDLPENHPDFLRAYAEAGNEPVQHKGKAGSIDALCVHWLGSRDFKGRKESTRIVWERILGMFRASYGPGMVKDLRPDHIQKDLRKVSPGAAKGRRTLWRALMKFAVEEGYRADNPAKAVSIPKYEQSPHIAWTQDDIDRFRAHWPTGTPQRQAMEVVYWTGARCVDARVLGWQLVSDGVLAFTQEKTGGEACVPINVPVDNFLETDRDHFLASVGPDLIWIHTRTGRPRSQKGLSQYISKAATDAGLPRELTAHGLRKARAAKLAENGWSANRIGAWTGHESLAEIAHYTRSADKKAMIQRTERNRKTGNRVVKIGNRGEKHE